jgi:chromosomal replication initiation ATPase DnaA
MNWRGLQVGVVFAYGQTGSGKTHTMNGLMDGLLADIAHTAHGKERRKVTFAYFEVLGNNINDCLVATQPKGGVQIGTRLRLHIT